MSFWSSTPEERRQYVYDEYISDPDFQQASFDYVKGMLTGGITSGYSSLDALARGDWEELVYWFKVEAAVIGTQYSLLQMLNYLQGPKYAMSFHQAHSAMGPARGLIAQTIGSYVVGGAVVGGTIHALETGDTTYTIQHQLLMPPINWWLSDLGRNDTRGGSEYGLFYNPQIERSIMNVCSSCKEPDHPLDDNTGLCYTCWLVACYEETLPQEEEE